MSNSGNNKTEGGETYDRFWAEIEAIAAKAPKEAIETYSKVNTKS